MSEWSDFAFWTEEELREFEALAPYVIEILARAGIGATNLLPANMRILMNWNTYNHAALDWLSRWRGGELAKIDQYTRERSIKVITEWVKSGEPLPLLVKRLATFVDSPARAKRIAVTEVTRMFAEGNIMAWQASGVVGGKRWMTAMDERVCPLCGPLEGKVVDLGDGWTMEEGEVVGGLGIMAPPLHINCRCSLQPIVDLEAARRRTFEILNNTP